MLLQVIVLALLVLIAVFLLYVAVVTVSALLVDSKKEYVKDSAYYRGLLQMSMHMLFFVCRINITVEGMDKVPDGPFLLVSNHRSKFDPMVSWLAFGKTKLAFISKEANFHIPWFGRVIRKCCCMAIDREDPRKALVTIDKAAELLESGEVCVGVYPEGTRSFDGELLPFHNGVLKIAQKAGVPIVVTTVDGTEQIHKNFIRHRTDILMRVVETIPAEAVKSERSSAKLGERVRQDMLKSLSNSTVHGSDYTEAGNLT